MSDGLLWDEVIVRQEIVHQGLFKFSRAPEAGPLAEFADASVHAFDHAVCPGMARRMRTLHCVRALRASSGVLCARSAIFPPFLASNESVVACNTHVQKTAACEKIGLNRPGRDMCSKRH
jgi:hypothetical protein